MQGRTAASGSAYFVMPDELHMFLNYPRRGVENGKNTHRKVLGPSTCRRRSRASATFERVGYSEEKVLQVFQISDLPKILTRRSDEPLLLHRVRGASPLEVLRRLFVLGEPVERDAFRRAIFPMRIDEWAKVGLVRQDRG